MAINDRRVVQEHISEINHYRKVLSRLMKHPVTLEQAITDWFDRGYHLTPFREDYSNLDG